MGPLSTEKLAIVELVLPRHLLQGISVPCAGAALGAESARPFRCARELRDGRRQSGRVPRRNENAGHAIDDCFAQPSDREATTGLPAAMASSAATPSPS